MWNPFKTEDPKEKKVKDLLLAVDKITSAYSKVLEQGRNLISREKDLPFPKDTIKQALKYSAIIQNNPAYTEAAGGCFVSLGNFRSDAEAEAWAEMNSAQQEALNTKSDEALMKCAKICGMGYGIEAMRGSTKESEALFAEWREFLKSSNLSLPEPKPKKLLFEALDTQIFVDADKKDAAIAILATAQINYSCDWLIREEIEPHTVKVWVFVFSSISDAQRGAKALNAAIYSRVIEAKV